MRKFLLLFLAALAVPGTIVVANAADTAAPPYTCEVEVDGCPIETKGISPYGDDVVFRAKCTTTSKRYWTDDGQHCKIKHCTKTYWDPHTLRWEHISWDENVDCEDNPNTVKD